MKRLEIRNKKRRRVYLHERSAVSLTGVTEWRFIYTHCCLHWRNIWNVSEWLPSEQRKNFFNSFSAIRSALTLPRSTWPNLSRFASPLGLCALFRMTELFASPPSKENTMVLVPFASLLPKFGISLPFAHRHSPSLPAFQNSLKTYLFKQHIYQ